MALNIDFTNTFITGSPLQPEYLTFFSKKEKKFNYICAYSSPDLLGYVFGIGNLTGIARIV